MRFKWAVYVAHRFARSCFDEACEALSLRTIAHKLPPLPGIRALVRSTGILEVDHSAVILLHILDDVNVVTFGWSDCQVIALHRQCVRVFEENGLPVKTSKSLPVGTVESTVLRFIGWSWHFQYGEIYPRSDKVADTISLLLRCLSSSSDPLRNVERALGRLVWLSLGMRPLLSVLGHTFRAIEDARSNGERHVAMGFELRRELAMMSTLVPLSRVDVRRSTWGVAVCFDASEIAGAVVYGDADPRELDPMAAPRNVEKVEWKKAVSGFVQSVEWNTAFAHQWTREEHINSLEAAAGVMALEWVASFPVIGKRIVIFQTRSSL